MSSVPESVPANSSAAAAAAPAVIPAAVEAPAKIRQNEPIDYSTRLYVGNVPFKITKQQIIDHFASKDTEKQNDFKITTVDILKKRTYNPKTKSHYMRSLGYIFINLDKESDLDSFISTFNDTDFNGLTIKVRKAVTHDETKQDESKESTSSDDSKQELPKKKELTEEQIAAKKEKAAAKRAAKKAKKAVALAAAKDGQTSADVSKETSPETSSKTKESEKKPAKKAPKEQQNPKVKKPLSEGTVSKNTVYLRNIDFYLTSGDLSKFLNEQTEYHPTWVHIPRRQLPAGQYHYLKKKSIPLKSKGFAFIRFKTEKEQLDFIKEFDGKIINKRQVSATAAVDFEDEEKLEENQQEKKEEEKSTPESS